MNKLEYPYKQMLEELKSVQGYNDFEEFLKTRISLNEHWKAELHALYEVNKPEHPLLKITSSDVSTPEGIFQVEEKQAIIEAKYIDLLFDTNSNVSKIEKVINSSLNSIKKHLNEGQSVAVFFNSDYLTKNLGVKAENACNEFKRKLLIGQELHYESGITFVLCNKDDLKYYGMTPIVKNAQVIDDYFIEVKKEGVLFRGLNRTLENEVFKSLSEKRKQVKDFGYPTNTIVLYYFYVNTPYLYRDDPAYQKFLEKLKPNEVLVLKNTSFINGEYCEGKTTLSKTESQLNLKNKYFK